MVSRLLRIASRILVVLLVLLLVVWIGASVAIKYTMMEEEPLPMIMTVVGQGLVSSISCAVTGCPAELLEGMESVPFGEGWVESTVVALDVDEHGRVLVAETERQNRGAEDNRQHMYWLEDDLASRSVEDRRAYYRKWIAEGKFENPDHFTSAFDRLVVLQDDDGDGIADSRKVMAEWNELASGLVAGVEAREGSIWVTAIPSLYRVDDEDADGDPESVETVHTGFGVKTSLIGHDLHGLVWGPDGKLYFSMGDRGYHVETPDGRVLEPKLGPGRGAVFRMNADGSDLEVFATGVRNPQELAFDDHGNLFTGDNNGDGGDKARIVYLVEGGETGWAMPYQTLVGDYVRGPWVAEKLWELQHETQPAWVLPPVSHVGNGPSGFLHYPGLGLPDRYDDAFFMCDYGYTPGRSGVWSFRVEPSGAGMEMVDLHHFAWSVLATDVDFGWDGRLYATLFDQFSVSSSVVRWAHEPSRQDPRVAEIAGYAQGRMADRDTPTLLELLRFPDQRLRLRAQYALADRGALAELSALLTNEGAELIPRLHALWGLAQIGTDALAVALPEGLESVSDAPVELRAKAAKAAGDTGWRAVRPTLLRWLGDSSLRLRFFAAEALGVVGQGADVPALFDVLEENADRDVFLRHAAVWAIHRITEREGDVARVVARRDDANRAVRMGALLVLRHADDPRIARFLADPDPLLIAEAARAIYDGPIDPAMAELAALAPVLEPAGEDDLQTGQALHRRVIGANVRLRSEEGARALARYAADEEQLEAMRSLALEQLGAYASPSRRDLTMGFYRPLPAADPAIVAAVFRTEGRPLIDSSLGARAMEIASEIGELPLEDEELVELARGDARALDERIAAMRALETRSAEGLDLVALATRAIEASEPSLRIAGRSLLLAVDPDAATEGLVSAARTAPTAGERRHAWVRLGSLASPQADAVIATGLDAWATGEGDPASAIELFEAAIARGGEAGARAKAWLTPPPVGDAETLVAARRWAVEGGDSRRGREVFQSIGDCQRCHGGGGGGHGGGVGPALDGISERGAEHVLASMLDPQAEIADGFATITVTRRDGGVVTGLLVGDEDEGLRLDVGDGQIESIALGDVAARTTPTTGMPAMGLVLPARDLRDVVAYVMSLAPEETADE